MPLGDWLVVVRFDSKVLDPTALDDGLNDIIAGIRFPASAKPGPAAVLVAPCPTPLDFKYAKLLKPDMKNVLLASVVAGIADKKGKESKVPIAPAQPLCRDGEPTAAYGVYHMPDVDDGYLLAVGDAGRTIGVTSGLSALLGSKEYTVTFNELDATMVYPGFDRLPEPAQLIDDVAHHSPLSRTAANKPNTIEIDNSQTSATGD